MRPRSSSRGRRRRGRARPQGGASGAEPLPLFKRAASHFEPGDRQRGQEYFQERRPRLEIDGARVRARVAGSEQPFYRVGVDWSRVPAERVLHAFCECQRFADGKPCKHLWSTLLAFAEAAPDGQPAGKDRLSLRRDRAASWPDLGIPPAEERREPRPEGQRPRPEGEHRRGRERLPPGRRIRLRPLESSWRSQLATVREEIARLAVAPPAAAPAQSTTATALAAGVRLLIDTTTGEAGGGLVLDVFETIPGGPARAGKLRRASLSADEVERLLLPRRVAEGGRDGVELALVAVLPAEPPGRPARGRRPPGGPTRSGAQRLRLPPQLYEPVLPRLCARGVLGWWDGRTPVDSPPLIWDEGLSWRLALRLQVPGAGAARLSGALERNGERVPLAATVAVLGVDGMAAAGAPPAPALVLFPDTLARLDAVPPRDLPWLALLRETGEVVIPQEELEEALSALLELPALPPLETPEGLQVSGERATPQPKLVLEPDPAPAWTNPPLLAQLSFIYGGAEVSAGDLRPAVIDPEGQRFVRRDMDAEHKALVRLLELGLRPVASAQGHGLELSPRDLPAVAEPLLREGWAVEVHGTTLRPPSPPALRIESGIDWFELSGEVDFAGDKLEMKRLLAAISKGERFVRLADGSQGLVPAEWMKTYDSLAKLAQGESEDGLRFLHSQALLVDALLAALPPAAVDSSFAALRERLSSFERIKPKKEPRGFVGTLRGYQRHGLGWLDFLREFGLGGVLADDMGLGKTVQVLALLEANRIAKSKAAKANGGNGGNGLPSLVVAPRSLVYNWIDEAERFTPKLKVLDYTGAEREEARSELGEYDLVVTTYGTLRRDVAFLASREFDTVILDEAQAIKNRESQAAKASRLLVARHRLALTGTPIENHLGELGSLFEFLNPGLLGRLPWLDVLAGGHQASQQELALVAKGMRPFILRRTKAQVLEDLPPKTEQILLTTLRPRQRELYDQLRAAYQASLLEQVETEGVGRSAIQVLEALLRLRQVACHPGLVNPEWADAGSAKLEALFEQVSEVLDEGHKVLVFSQFTSLLAFVRQHLDGLGVPYAYLDGSTRDRGAVVEKFQTDPKTNLFLISLKAGGVGLNLTAAGYVFLLDPWWNPAVEAQAIDRAHRIGQSQPVFAYKLIARDTVEEKMLELQKSKRQLAETILDGGGEGQGLSELTADDLRMLLS